MQQPRESSLLFSLAELQRMEDERLVEERAAELAKAAAENAEAMQKQEARAAAKRLSDERTAEMVALREQVQETKAEIQERHVELLTLREYRRLSEIPEPAALVSTVEFPQTISRTSHLWWAATVVAACAVVYMIVGNTGQKQRPAGSSPVAINTAPPPSAQPVVAAAMPCTEVAIESAAREPDENVEHADATRNGGDKGRAAGRGKGTKSRPRGGKKDPPRDELPATPKHCIGSTNPLCGIDDL